MQAYGEGPGNVGVCESSSKRVRVCDGAGYLCTSGCSGMVPICLRVPDQAAIQPSFQPRASDPTYSCWWEEAQVKLTKQTNKQPLQNYFHVIICGEMNRIRMEYSSMKMYNIVCYMQCNIRIIHRMKMQIFFLNFTKQTRFKKSALFFFLVTLCHVNFQFRAVSGFRRGLQRIPNFYLRGY